jgi:hypothetical protein
VGVKGGAEVAVIEMENVEEIEPSVKVSCAVPELEKVTANGVRMEDVEIFAPVNDHETTVLGVIFVLFWSSKTKRIDDPWQTVILLLLS